MLLINNDDVTKLLSMKDCVEALEVAKEQPLMGNLDRRLRRLESQQQACNHWNGQHPNVLLVNPKLDEVALMENRIGSMSDLSKARWSAEDLHSCASRT